MARDRPHRMRPPGRWGVPIAALLRAYRLGSARFQDWCLQELGRQTDNASIVSAAGLRIAEITAIYIDRVSEELVSAYEAEKENWLRNLSAARAARVRALLNGERVDVDSSEAILGYRLRQHHIGVVCWLGEAEPGGGALARLEHATAEVARRAECEERPIFLPQDESSAWARDGAADAEVDRSHRFVRAQGGHTRLLRSRPDADAVRRPGPWVCRGGYAAVSGARSTRRRADVRR
jgi:hypothetical protein